MTPGLLAPLSSSPGGTTPPERYLAQVGSRSSARAQDQPLNRRPNNEFRTYNWMCRCYGHRLLMVSGGEERPTFLLGRIVIQLERNNCRGGQRAVTA